MSRINDRIRAPKVRVIDGTSGKQLGVMNTLDAVRAAKEVGLDLVEVTSNVDPPVCKIIDYGKYKYEQSKQKKDNRSKARAARVKEVKFRVRIDKHDYDIKMAHAEEFLDDGHKLRVQLQFRGREMAHQELGFELMERVREDLKTMGHVDMEPRKAGRAISMMLSPLPKQQRVRKYAKPTAPMLEDDDEDDDDDHGDEAQVQGGDVGMKDAKA